MAILSCNGRRTGARPEVRLSQYRHAGPQTYTVRKEAPPSAASQLPKMPKCKDSMYYPPSGSARYPAPFQALSFSQSVASPAPSSDQTTLLWNTPSVVHAGPQTYTVQKEAPPSAASQLPKMPKCKDSMYYPPSGSARYPAPFEALSFSQSVASPAPSSDQTTLLWNTPSVVTQFLSIEDCICNCLLIKCIHHVSCPLLFLTCPAWGGVVGLSPAT